MSTIKFIGFTSVITKTLCFRILLTFQVLAIGFSQNIFSQNKDFFISNDRKVIRADFDSEVEKMMEAVGVPGLSLAIIENDQIAYYGTYGYKENKEEMVDRETVFEVASLSKPYLTCVAFQLVDEGLLDLDKPIYQYLENKSLAHDERYKLITPRMIIGHSSGLENWSPLNDSEKLEIIETPGEKFTYSGEGFNYLAWAIEKLLNQPYEEYVKERVLEPLNLKNTYLLFERTESVSGNLISPSNYANGYYTMGHEEFKWVNEESSPASGANATAEDYAKLILGIFKNSSKERLKEILTPVVKIKGDKKPVYSGLGFELNYSQKDSIIAHSGSNLGFRSDLFYSIKSKRGIVILTNFHRGDILSKRLSELSVGLDLSAFLDDFFFQQYPSIAIDLLKTYRENGIEAVLKEIDELNTDTKSIDEALNEVGDELLHFDDQSAIMVLERNLILNPESETTYYLLGKSYLNLCKYERAYEMFLKAKELNFNLWGWNPEKELESCDALMLERKNRKKRMVPIARLTKIEAENYNEMCGIKTENTTDRGKGKNIGYTSKDDWMSYDINIDKSGKYSLLSRIASFSGGGIIDVLLDNKTISKIEIPQTGDWQNWKTIENQVEMAAGEHKLKLHILRGEFNLNWIKFRRLN